MGVINGLDSDQDQQNVSPDLGPKLFAKFISRRHVTVSMERVKARILLLSECQLTFCRS